jgi:hypothetical protein
MSAEQRLSPVQTALFPQESDRPTDQNVYRDQIEQAYVALYQKRLGSDDLTPSAEEMVLGRLVRVLTPYHWELSPLAGLIYEREQFRQSHESLMQPAQFTKLDRLFEGAIRVHTTNHAERAYFERMQRQEQQSQGACRSSGSLMLPSSCPKVSIVQPPGAT